MTFAENMKSDNFIVTMQRRTGVTAVGPSALRGQGAGVLKATQNYLGSIELSNIPATNQEEYNKWLDAHTETILSILPIRNKPWGAARKALNLFMRDVLYNRYLCDHFGIRKFEKWMELPLDSAVAKGLKKLAGRRRLPPWPGLKRLKEDTSQIYQSFATEYSRTRGISRVHLDIYLWTENR